MTKWTIERIEILRDGYVKGMTVSEILEKMQPVSFTRRSLIGKAHRMGFQHPGFLRPRKAKKPAVTKEDRQAYGWSKIAMMESQEGKYTFEQLESNMCRYPMGKLWCGAASEGSWCPYHLSIVTAPAQPKALSPSKEKEIKDVMELLPLY